ncbi:MAG: putative 4-hydroxybutyrate CoA-transferase [Acidimicrobiaceae bacterium]|nr:MAG: putative 4-hydroxybutyrate CoA-transferase [Acidimicrobiaceae bacterium]
MTIDAQLKATRVSAADAVIHHLRPGTEIIVPIANGEPVTLLDAIERCADALDGVTVHQMHALRDRPMMRGAFGDRLHHISYFLSHITRPHFHAGTVDLVPNHFSEVYDLIAHRATRPLVLAAAAPPDRHGNFSLGVSADYTTSFIGRAPFFLEVNRQMPRTSGRNQIHVSQVLGWVEADYPLITSDPASPSDVDRQIGRLVAERIPDGATIQAGIGAIPNAMLGNLTGHHNLGVHTELISDGLIDLIETGVVNGTAKTNNRLKVIGTFALGTQRLYDFVHDNPTIELWPARYVNDPRIISRDRNFVSINASLAVDFLGQCASETIGGRYYSSSGGQADFARGAAYSEGGQSFIVLQSTARDGTLSRIVPQLAPGDVVTTVKNTVDKVVTEHGVAELRGRTIRERAGALIAVADPRFRDELHRAARELRYL